MPVESQTPFNEHTGNGVTTVFAYQFQVLVATDLAVFVDGALKANGTDYTISGVGTLQGGQVTFSVAPASGADVLLARQMVLARDTDYQTNGDLKEAVLDRDFDRIWLVLQGISANFNTFLRFPFPEQARDLPKKSDRINRILSFDSSGQPVTSLPTSDSAQELRTELADFSGANLVGYDKTETYSPGTVGYAITDLSNSAIRTNHLWAGFFRVWQQGGALNVRANERVYISDGGTYAREGFVTGVTAFHVIDPAVPDTHGVRLVRTVGNASTNSANGVYGLTQEESAPLIGRKVCLQADFTKLDGYTGVAPTIRLQISREPEQGIFNADGTYTNGHEVLGTATGLGELSIVADIPNDAIQISAAVVVPFAGSAPVDDGVNLFRLYLTEGDQPTDNVIEPPFNALHELAKTRYQTSYPYGAPRGTLTEQGSLSALAVSTAVTWALAENVRLKPNLALTPQFLFQSTLSGTESRMTDTVTQTVINGLAYNLSDSGVTVSNNAAVVDGRRYLFQWTAISKI